MKKGKLLLVIICGLLLVGCKEAKKEDEPSIKTNITPSEKVMPKIEFTKELSTTKGAKIDLLKGVKATDSEGKEITVTVEGKYDFNKEGTYKLKYVALDSNNNKTEEEFILNVTKPVCTEKSGSWSTKKPSSECKYTTKKLVWRWQMVVEEDGTEKWAWTIDVNYKGMVGSALPSQIDKTYDEYKYLSTQPKENYTDNKDHEKNINVYIIK